MPCSVELFPRRRCAECRGESTTRVQTPFMACGLLFFSSPPEVNSVPVPLRPLIALAWIATALLACAAFAAEFQPATIVDASTQNELLSNGTGGVVGVPQSTVTVLIAGLKITAQYYTANPSGPKAASQLVVGDMVQ